MLRFKAQIADRLTGNTLEVQGPWKSSNQEARRHIKDRDEEVFFLLQVAAEYSSELEAPQSVEEADRYTIISFQITGG